MQSSKANKIIFNLFVVSNFVFVFLFLALCYYNRMASDDFYSASVLRDHGAIDGMILSYNTWTGRWAVGVLGLIISPFYPSKYFLFIYGILLFLLLVFSLKRLLHNLTELLQWSSIGLWKELHLTIFIVSAIFYSSIKIDETWFFFASTCVYLMSLAMFLLGTSALISSTKNTFNTLLLFVCFTFIGGACEPFALIVLLLLAIIGIAHFLGRIQVNLPKEYFNKRIALAFIFCFFSFMILCLAEGNTIRMGFFKEITLWEAVLINVKITGMIILYRLPAILPFVLIFTIPGYYLGSLRSEKKPTLLKNLILILIFFAFVYLYHLPITYITSDIGAYRALFPISLAALIILFLIFYNIGASRVISSSIVPWITILSILFVCFLNIYSTISQLKIVPKYAAACDKRILYLEQNKENAKTIIVEPLPNAGWLYSAEISTDTSYFRNQHLKRGLGLRSGVMLKNTKAK